MDNMLEKDFCLGFTKINIVHLAAKKPVFGALIAREFAKHGHIISPGTLYPILHRLERDGYLESQLKTVHGKVHKYYQTTTKGKTALGQAKRHIENMVNEIIQ